MWLSVADEGEGMEQSTIGKIFDPFYTTKDPGKGRGLGLSVCHRIIEEAGGHIEVHSAPGLGSVFTVRLRKAPESKRNSHMEGNDGNEQKSHSDH
jgi:signal transduction histidine kinase